MIDELSKLRDIKPPVEIDKFSWMPLILATIILISILALFFWIKHKKTKKTFRRYNPIKEAKEKLKSIDFLDSKSTVYTFDEYLPILIKEDKEALKEFEELQKELQKYKYKKDVPPISEDDKEKIKRLIDRFIR